jgi:nucleoside phosphorylase/CheY-like chemotaxis protein
MTRVLVVEDGALKLPKLFAAIDEVGLSRDLIDVVQSSQDARQKLRAQKYDILILDIAIPMRLGDEPKEKNATELLTEIVERSTLKRPDKIIGITAYSDIAERVSPIFADYAWTVLHVEESSDEWTDTLKHCFRYALEGEGRVSARASQTDICIVSALADPEQRAVLKLPWSWSAARPLDDCTFVSRGSFSSGSESYSVLSTSAPRMGSVATAVVAAKLIELCRPKFLVMSGICAGYRSETSLGDPIFADVGWDYQSGKHFVENGEVKFAAAPHHLNVPEAVRTRMDLLRRDTQLWERIRSEWPTPPDTVLKLIIAPLASGSAVRADGTTFEALRAQQHRKLAGLDMEVYGLYAAAANSGTPRPTAIAVKSVSDFADEQKGGSHRAYAAYTSAQTIRFFFERFMSQMME